MYKRPSSKIPRYRQQQLSPQSEADPIVTNIPTSTKFNWKMGAIGFGLVGALSAPVFWQLAQPSILHLNLVDISDSAKNNQKGLPEQVCQIGSQYRKLGDRSVTILYANQAEVVDTENIQDQLTALSVCKKALSASAENTTKYNGTNIVAPLKQAVRVIKQQRQEKAFPVIVTMTLDEAESGPGIPELDWQEINKLVNQITIDRGILAIIGPTGELQNELLEKLNRPGVLICPSLSASDCVGRAFNQGRSL